MSIDVKMMLSFQEREIRGGFLFGSRSRVILKPIKYYTYLKITFFTFQLRNPPQELDHWPACSDAIAIFWHEIHDLSYLDALASACIHILNDGWLSFVRSFLRPERKRKRRKKERNRRERERKDSSSKCGQKRVVAAAKQVS